MSRWRAREKSDAYHRKEESDGIHFPSKEKDAPLLAAPRVLPAPGRFFIRLLKIP